MPKAKLSAFFILIFVKNCQSISGKYNGQKLKTKTQLLFFNKGTNLKVP
jgi:hypothetical protein